MTPTIALALAAAEQAMGSAAAGRRPLRTVFACSGGDTEVMDRICRALLDARRPVSPGDFHHSVHNAPAGYWSIGQHEQAPTVSLSAYDASFTAGLLEAATQLADGGGPILLVAYDTPAPHPIWPFRPLTAAFAVALRLDAPCSGGREARLALISADEPTRLADEALESLRLGNPAARALPLLAALTRPGPQEITLPYLPGSGLRLRLGPAGMPS